MTCSGLAGHPQYQNGRIEDPHFLPNELLYRRYKANHFENGLLLPAAFQFPRQSFNRQKYSVPHDVLHPDCCDGEFRESWGILECSTDDLPMPVTGPDSRQFHFTVAHVPSECCFAHSELRCQIDGVVVDRPSPKVRETFRVQLSLKMRVYKVAEA